MNRTGVKGCVGWVGGAGGSLLSRLNVFRRVGSDIKLAAGYVACVGRIGEVIWESLVLERKVKVKEGESVGIKEKRLRTGSWNRPPLEPGGHSEAPSAGGHTQQSESARPGQ